MGWTPIMCPLLSDLLCLGGALPHDIGSRAVVAQCHLTTYFVFGYDKAIEHFCLTTILGVVRI